MRVLVCGSRDFTDRRIVYTVLVGMTYFSFKSDSPVVVIEGGALGADRFAAEWAEGSNHLRFPADWTKHGKAAGPIRNQTMLDEGKPDIVVAFVNKPLAESRGTADMVRRARKAGVPTYVIESMGAEA